MRIAVAPACIPPPINVSGQAQQRQQHSSNHASSAVVVVVSAVGGGVKPHPRNPTPTNQLDRRKEGRNVSLQLKSLTTQRMLGIAALIMIAAVFVLGCSKKQDNTAAEAPQKTFATPAEASQALHAAVQAKDDKALTQVLGPKAQKLVSSGDPAEDKSAADSFAKKYDQMNRLVAMTDGSQVLYIGADNYPFPVPLAQDSSSRWYFDAAAADEELRARRIGGNELSAMDACRHDCKCRGTLPPEHPPVHRHDREHPGPAGWPLLGGLRRPVAQPVGEPQPVCKRHLQRFRTQ